MVPGACIFKYCIGCINLLNVRDFNPHMTVTYNAAILASLLAVTLTCSACFEPPAGSFRYFQGHWSVQPMKKVEKVAVKLPKMWPDTVLDMLVLK